MFQFSKHHQMNTPENFVIENSMKIAEVPLFCAFIF